MNRENILAVADAIEKHTVRKLGFNMNILHGRYHVDHSGHSCGTCACIAGWTCVINSEMADFEMARKLLGLDDDKANDLFWADGADASLGNITPSQAVSVLRHLAETGEVDWDRALAEPVK